MMKKDSKKLLEYELKKIFDINPGLNARYNGDVPIEIYGTYLVKDISGEIQDSFDILVKIPTDYPLGFPVLFETSNKIERIDDRHIDKNGACCVEITQRILLIRRSGITLTEFFKRYVHKFFCWQILYEAEGPGALLQWPHGPKGTEIFYYELIGVTDKRIIRKFIESVLNNSIPNRKDDCICGSGKRTKKCHGGIFFDLEQIGSRQLVEDLKLFINSHG